MAGTLRKKKTRASIVRALGVVLLIYFGLAAISNMGTAWGWQRGEAVQVEVASTCRGFVDSGFLTDCTGSWTTADGQSHSGDIVGFNEEHLGQTVSARAHGDKAYYEPQLMTKIVGLPAPFAGGLAVLLLVLSFVIAPSRRKLDEEVAEIQARPVPDDVAELARARGLGATVGTHWSNNGTERVVTLFEHGFVYAPTGEQPTAFRWDDISAVWEEVTRTNNVVTHQYSLQVANRQPMIFTDRLVADLPALGKVFLGSVGNRVLPAVLAAAQGGPPYTFPGWRKEPDTVLSGQGISGPDGTIPWNDFANVAVQNGRITIQGTRGTLARTWSRTGNAAILVTVLRAILDQRTGQAQAQRPQ